MNKIRVCAFLALVVFIGSVVTDMFSGFMDGWNEAGDQKDFHALPSVSLLVGIYHDLASQVQLEGYEVLPYSFKYAWFNYMLLALFTEIFAIGVKIKEEQDLTV